MSNEIWKFIECINKNENAKINNTSENYSDHTVNNRKSIDIDQLTKLMLFWIVGGIISLMPDIVSIFTKQDINDAIKEFFSNENIFVVSTTLNISVLLEMIFDKKVSNVKYIFLGFLILITVFSVHLSAMLHFNININNIQNFGLYNLIFSAFLSITGYVLVCVTERR